MPTALFVCSVLVGCQSNTDGAQRDAEKVVLAWIDAAWKGDADASKALLADTDADDRQIIDDMLAFNSSLRRLEAAAIKRFGEADGKRVTGYPDGSAAATKDLQITVKGDTATATVGNAMFPMQLKRQDGSWKVSFETFLTKPDVRANLQRYTQATKAADEVTAKIEAGQFKSAEETCDEFRKLRLARVKSD